MAAVLPQRHLEAVAGKTPVCGLTVLERSLGVLRNRRNKNLGSFRLIVALKPRAVSLKRFPFIVPGFSWSGFQEFFSIMFEEASEVFDNMLKSAFPLTIIVFLPAVLILVSPLPAEAAHEFTVYRMQQYDLQGQNYGTDVLLTPENTFVSFKFVKIS